MMFQSLRLVAVAAIAIGLLMIPVFISSADSGSDVSIIVELHDDPAALHAARAQQAGTTLSDDQIQAYRDQLTAAQNQFLDALRSEGINFQLQSVDVKGYDGSVAGTIQLRYTLVFNGMSLTVSDAAVSEIEQMPQVKKVHSNDLLYTSLDRSVSYIRAPQVYGAVPELTQFDDFREGFEGQGIHIAVIDTGIDWTHEMFGGDPTPPRLGAAPAAAAVNTNRKVIYNLPLMDAIHDGFGHGTHVASTAAGYLGFAPGPDRLPLTSDDVRLHGVAPQAKLMSYKVCSDVLSTVSQVRPVGGCFTNLIVMAIEDAVSPRTVNGLSKPVAHVINMSLGGAGGPTSATAVASDNAVLSGTTVVASAGNSGPGEGTVGAPAAGRRVIAVGANTDPGVVDNSIDVLEADRSTVRPGTPKMQAIFAPESNATRKIASPIVENYVFGGLADTPDQVPVTVAGRICLTERGSTATVAGQGTGLFANKAANCAAKGAIAMVVFNNVPGPTGVVLGPSTIPVFGISREHGLFLRDTLGFEPTGISRFPIRINLEDPSLFSADMAGFSSRGPVQGFGQVKPDVTAPGVSVLAAVPPASLLGALAASNYGSVSGTSMSSPHTAGAVALVKQAHPGWDPDMIRTALGNTATNLRDPAATPSADGTSNVAILAQGGGLIDVFEAINARALMGVAGDGITNPSILGSHSFNQVPVVNSRCAHTESVTVTIRDVSGEGGSYNLAVANNRELERGGITVQVEPASVAVPSNGQATFQVNATVDGDLIRSGILQLQWFVLANRSDDTETLRMPIYLRATPSVAAAPGADPPTLQTIQGEFVDSQGRQIDFDGAFTVQWTPRGGETGFEVEHCAGAGCSDWQVLANVAASTTSLSLSNQQNGDYSFRVRGLFPGQICNFVTAPSNVESIVELNHAPTAAVSANPTSGFVPLTVNFDGSGSSDPDPGDTLTYTFNFGDLTASITQSNPIVVHTFSQAGSYIASLTVKDRRGDTSNIAQVTITVSAPPIATLLEDDDSRIAYSNGWHRGSDQNASADHFRYHVGDKQKHFARLDFEVQTGQTGVITYFFAKSSKGGSADIYLDGLFKGTVNYTGSIGSTKHPEFKPEYNVRYGNLVSGSHRLEIRNLIGVVYVDRFVLESSGSNAQPSSGPGTTSDGESSVAAGQSSSNNYQMEPGAREISVVAECNVDVPFQLVLVDPSGLTLETANSLAGLATIDRPVTGGGIYVIKVINLSLGPLQITVTTTPLVAR